MIDIYTDISITKSGEACGACIVLTDTSFMGYNIFKLKSNMKPVLAEMRTCIYSVEYALRLCPNQSDDSITLHCDNESVVNIVHAESYTGKFSNDRNKLIKLLRENNINLEYVKGHSVYTNPNVAVDGIARAFFRRE